MIRRNVSYEELHACETLTQQMDADMTVSVPAEVLYNLAREIKENRQKVAAAGSAKNKLLQKLETMAKRRKCMQAASSKLKKKEAASTGMDTTSGVDLTEPTQNIIAQRKDIEQYLTEKHLQSDSVQMTLELDPSINVEDLKKIIKELVGYVMAMQDEGGGENV